MKNYFYEEAGVELINEYNKKIDALIEEIKNTPTELEFTGTTYYVSSSMGDDNNDGKTPETAWKSLEKVNESRSDFKHGTNILLKRGDSWRLRPALNIQSGTTLSTYGEGAKPKIICSVDASKPSDWEKTEIPNVYKYTGEVGGFERNIGAIIFDGGRAWGIHTTPCTGIYTPETKDLRVDNGPVFNGLEHYTVPPNSKFEGPQDLAGNLEFFHDMPNEALYIYCREGNPAEVFESVELSERGHGIQICCLNLEDKVPFKYRDEPVVAAYDITIDNIHIFGAGTHGIGGGTLKNVLIQNCILEWIGGVVQFPIGENIFKRDFVIRLGNAVEAYGSCDNFEMHHNYATQVYDCCWTVQHLSNSVMSDLHIHDNVAEFANTGSEVWLGEGRVVNMQIHDNFDRYIGYGYSHQRPSTTHPTDKLASGWVGAGGFFYGAGNTNMQCEGNNVCNNVYMLAGSSSHSLAAVYPDKYNFHDNVYIMEDGKKLGAYEPFKGMYTEENIAECLEKAQGAEKGTKFYHIKPGQLGDMYKLCVKKFEK